MRAATALAVVSLALAACVGPQDDPSTVKDLRVLGMRFDPPEVMIRGCDPSLFGALLSGGGDGGVPQLDPQVLQRLALGAAVPLDFTTLIADPAGAGRELRYSVRVCANVSDRTCTNEGDWSELQAGSTRAGELTVRTVLGTHLFADGTPLLLEVINQDTYKGLGGIRVPVVVHLTALDTGEEIYAQKLMVFQCRFFPGMRQNVQPALPGVTLEGESWAEGEVRPLSGRGPFKVEPLDFAALQEPYVVPSLSFKPVSLEERWKLARYATLGTFGPWETGGFDLTGQTERHNATWSPDPSVTEPRDVDFWFVVRDGRGGQSWLNRQARWTP